MCGFDRNVAGLISKLSKPLHSTSHWVQTTAVRNFFQQTLWSRMMNDIFGTKTSLICASVARYVTDWCQRNADRQMDGQLFSFIYMIIIKENWKSKYIIINKKVKKNVMIKNICQKTFVCQPGSCYLFPFITKIAPTV